MNEKPADIREDDEAWPFPNVPPEVYWSLPKSDRDGIEQIARDLVNKTNSKH